MHNLISQWWRAGHVSRVRGRLALTTLALLTFVACSSSSNGARETFSGRWRDSSVRLDACGYSSDTVADLTLQQRGDSVSGSLQLLSGRTGLLLTGSLSGSVEDDALTAEVIFTGGSATLTLTGADNLGGDLVFPAALVCPEDGSQDITVDFASFTPRAALDPQNDWRNEVIYFALTDRFANGDSSNDDGVARSGAFDEADLSNIRGWHGGDFAGIEAKIAEGYFADLGVTALWISPIKLQIPAIDMRDFPNVFSEDVWFNDSGVFAGFHGYWAEDFLSIDPHFGTLDDLRSLIDTAHASNIKIIQDIVVNHTGYGATLLETQPTWFHDDADCAGSDKPDQDCELARLPDLDQDVPAVTAFLNAVVNYYIETFGIDGIRMDTVKHVSDDYWRQFFAPGGVGDPERIWLVGEIFTGDIPFLASYLNDFDLPAVFDFPLYYRINDHLSSAAGNLDDIAEIFDQDSLYEDPTRLVTFVDNHDVQRFITRTINNGVARADAEDRLDMALSLIFFARGIPQIYYGTEIGMEGENDPRNRDFMDFTALAQSDLAERIAALAAARRQYRALTHGDQQMLSRPSDNGGSVLAFRRTLAGEPSVVTVMNNADERVDLRNLNAGGIPLLGTFASGVSLTEVSGVEVDVTISDGLLVGSLPPRSAVALAGAAGSSTGGSNPSLGTVSNLSALPGGGAVKLDWTPTDDPAALGYRVYYSSTAEQVQNNFAPIGANVTSTIVRGLDNGVRYDFTVVTVDGDGLESTDNPSVSAAPNESAISRVTFVVDARSQGGAPMEIRRFDTGSQLEYPLTPVPGQRGFYETTLELPLFREISFKFANNAPTAKNGGYEGVGTNNRLFLLDDAVEQYEGIYNFIEGLPPGTPNAAITGTVTSLGEPVAGAFIDAALDDRFYFAFTFADGSFYLPLPAGIDTTLTASAPGLVSSSLDASAPTEVALVLEPPTTRYTVDGDLSDWGDATLINGAEGHDFGFGANNLFNELYVDADEDYLYLAYRYRAESSNATIVFIDVVDGGVSAINELDTFAKWATFSSGIDAMVAQEGGGTPRLLELSATETTSQAAITATVPASEDGFGFISEVAIPWSSLGVEAMPMNIDLYGGVFGGGLYGAGDIIPNRNSTPAAAANSIQPQYDGDTPRLANFETPLTVNFGQ